MDGATRLVRGNALTFILWIETNSAPFPDPVFKTQTLTSRELLVVFALSSIVFIAVELEKLIKRRKKTS